MEEISPSLTRCDVVEPASMSAVGCKVQLADANQGSKATNTPLTRAIENFYFTDAISRSSPTMGRCSAAKMQTEGVEADPAGGEAAYASG